MPLITSQPSERQNIPDSVLEANSLKVSSDMEWENEWNHTGLASGLTPEVELQQYINIIVKRNSNEILKGEVN